MVDTNADIVMVLLLTTETVNLCVIWLLYLVSGVSTVASCIDLLLVAAVGLWRVPAGALLVTLLVREAVLDRRGVSSLSANILSVSRSLLTFSPELSKAAAMLEGGDYREEYNDL